MLRRIATILVAALLMHIPNVSAQKAKPKPKSQPSATNPVLQAAPLDTSKERLPKYFIGSPVELIHLMFVGGPKKGEFETTTEYERRRKEYLQTGVYCFQLADVAITYDADTGAFNVKVDGEALAVSSASSQTVTAFNAASVVPDEGGFLRSMSLGAENSTGTYRLVANSRIPLPVDIAVPMSRDTARTTKPYLRVVLLLDLDAAAAEQVVQGEKLLPLREADGYPHYDLALKGVLRGIWVYDFRSGEVLARYANVN